MLLINIGSVGVGLAASKQAVSFWAQDQVWGYGSCVCAAADDVGGGVQQPVAQGLGLGFREGSLETSPATIVHTGCHAGQIVNLISVVLP
jgi:hypothetical protein